MKLNLIYFIAPFAHNDEWRKNVIQIRRRIQLFDGRRIIVVAHDRLTVDPQIACHEFRDCECFVEPHMPQLGDTAGFIRGMLELEKNNPGGATFFAHAKGVTRPNEKVIMWWRNFLYHACLDDPDAVIWALKTHPVAGAMRCTRVVGEFPDGIQAPPWYYAGSFFWFRNKDVLPHEWDRPGKVIGTRWGTERWPANMWSLAESHCLAMDNCTKPYETTNHPVRIED